MITAYQFLKTYCSERNLPEPNSLTISGFGRFISHHFKNYWAVNQPDEILDQVRIVRQVEPHGTYIVTAYPNSFIPDMAERASLFYHIEKKKVEEPEKFQEILKEKKLRKRIARKSTPVFSSNKPSQH